MLFLKRRRLVFWLLRAYLRRWRKTILFFFLFGLIFFFAIKFLFSYFSNKIPFVQKEVIGIVGAYTIDDLPDEILSKVSRGLTYTSDEGLPKPDVVSSWEIKNDGKKYVFHLKDNIYFNNGDKLNSSSINYDFLDVEEERPDKNTIIFKLKESYSPFLTTVSRPIFKKNFTGLIGLGDYKIKKIKLNGNFVQSIDLVFKDNDYQIISYQMYPTEDALKMAYILGEITKAKGLTDIEYDGSNFANYKNTDVIKYVDKNTLVTLFYNTQDPVLSDKKLRNALTYATPDVFENGERTYGPFSSKFWGNTVTVSEYQQDFDHSIKLLEVPKGQKPPEIRVNIKTLAKYKDIAEQLKETYKNIGITVSIESVEAFPQTFQIFLGDYTVPKDPDQYTLWHSNQQNNITKYKNLRIDKLLEDGRKEVEIGGRQKIYSDLEKYLLDDSPATFLYFPYKYDLLRK